MGTLWVVWDVFGTPNKADTMRVSDRVTYMGHTLPTLVQSVRRLFRAIDEIVVEIQFPDCLPDRYSGKVRERAGLQLQHGQRLTILVGQPDPTANDPDIRQGWLVTH